MAETITRGDFHRYFSKVGWPTGLPVLVDIARRGGAPDAFVQGISSLPDRIYMSEDDTWGEYQAQLKKAA